MIGIIAFFQTFLCVFVIPAVLYSLAIVLAKYTHLNGGIINILVIISVLIFMIMLFNFSKVRGIFEDSLYKKQARKDRLQELEDEFRQIIRIKEWEYSQDKEKMILLHNMQMEFEDRKKQDMAQLESIINRVRGM